MSEGAVEALLREAEATLHKLSELVALTRAFNTGIVSLCKWLERLTMRLCSDSGPTCLSADDALAIAKFIRVHLSHDRVGAVLDGAEGAGMGLAPIDAEKLNAGLMAKLGMALPAATRRVARRSPTMNTSCGLPKRWASQKHVVYGAAHRTAMRGCQVVSADW